MKRVFSWLSAKTEVRRTGKYGWGVYATKPLKKNELVAVAGGYVMTLSEIKKLPKRLEYFSFQIEEQLYFGVKKSNEVEDDCRFNHSCAPNLGQRNQLSLVALRDIKAGEELTFDYAMTLCRINGAPLFKMKCYCNKQECRRVITDEDWKIPQLQKKYGSYFQPFILEKIKLRNKRRLKK